MKTMSEEEKQHLFDRVMDAQTTDPARVGMRDIFGFYDGDFGERNEDHLKQIQDAVESGHITLERLEEYLPIEEEYAARLPRIFGGKRFHWQKCYQAALWMTLRDKEWEPESWYPAGRADLVCAADKLAVECGNVKVQKVMRALENGWSVMMIPYLADTKEGRTLVFVFRPAKPPTAP